MMNNVMIYRSELPEAGRSARREAERAAVARLVTTVFGPDATIAHRDDGSPYVEERDEVYVSVADCAVE